MKQKLIELQRGREELQGETDQFANIAEDFNILLSIIDRSSMKTTSKDIAELNTNINQLDKTDIQQKQNIHFFLKFAKNIHQDRPHLGP